MISTFPLRASYLRDSLILYSALADFLHCLSLTGALMKYATQSLAKGVEETNMSTLANVLCRGACRFSGGMRWQLFRFAGYCGFDHTFANESNTAAWWH